VKDWDPRWPRSKAGIEYLILMLLDQVRQLRGIMAAEREYHLAQGPGIWKRVPEEDRAKILAAAGNPLFFQECPWNLSWGPCEGRYPMEVWCMIEDKVPGSENYRLYEIDLDLMVGLVLERRDDSKG
jgi:hypothetical protein